MSLSRRLPVALVLVALAPLLGLDGCDDSPMACTLIGCDTAYLVTLAPTDTALPAGDYEVRVTAGGEVRSCTFTAAPCTMGTCPEDAGEGCRSLYADDEGLVNVAFEPVEGQVTVDVVRDGATVADAVVVPAYEPQYPNGIDCGAACETARTVLPIE